MKVIDLFVCVYIYRGGHFLDSRGECLHDVSAVVVDVVVLDSAGESDIAIRGLRLDADGEEAQVLQLLLGDGCVHYALGEHQLGPVQGVRLDDLSDNIEVLLRLDVPCE